MLAILGCCCAKRERARSWRRTRCKSSSVEELNKIARVANCKFIEMQVQAALNSTRRAVSVGHRVSGTRVWALEHARTHETVGAADSNDAGGKYASDATPRNTPFGFGGRSAKVERSRGHRNDSVGGCFQRDAHREKKNVLLPRTSPAAHRNHAGYAAAAQHVVAPRQKKQFPVEDCAELFWDRLWSKLRDATCFS